MQDIIKLLSKLKSKCVSNEKETYNLVVDNRNMQEFGLSFMTHFKGTDRICISKDRDNYKIYEIKYRKIKEGPSPYRSKEDFLPSANPHVTELEVTEVRKTLEEIVKTSPFQDLWKWLECYNLIPYEETSN